MFIGCSDDEDDKDPDPEGDLLLDTENGVDWYKEVLDDDEVLMEFDTATSLDRGLSVDDLIDEQLERELADAGKTFCCQNA